MELEKKKSLFAEKGLTIIGISYDPVETLSAFAEKYNISFPLLSDTSSQVIKAFDILNSSAKPGSRAWGVPYPGIYIIDENLLVVSKQFEEAYYERPSANTILAEHFGQVQSEQTLQFNTTYMTGSISLSDSTAYPAQILALTVTIHMKEGFHLYGEPIAEGYVPLTISLEESPQFQTDEFLYPQTTPLKLPGLDETFNILPSAFTLKGRIRIAKNPMLGECIIKGTISFQACNDKVCYPPEEVRVLLPLKISKRY